MTRVLVADPDPRSRAGWVDLLRAEKDLKARGVAGAALLLERATGADVVVLVLGPGTLERAVEIIAAVAVGPGTPVVVLADDASAQCVPRALEAGAVGALVADSSPAQVVAAVRAAADGDTLESDTGLMPVSGPLVRRTGHDASPLTDKEIEVLALAAQGLSNQGVADRLYVSVSTVKSHLSHAFGRLGVRHRGAAIAEARRRDLLP